MYLPATNIPEYPQSPSTVYTCTAVDAVMLTLAVYILILDAKKKMIMITAYDFSSLNRASDRIGRYGST